MFQLYHSLSRLRVVHKLIGSGIAWIHVSPMAVKTQQAFDKFCFIHVNELRSIYLNNNEHSNWHYVHQSYVELLLRSIYFIRGQTSDVYYRGLYLGYQGSETFGNLLIGSYYSGIKICHDSDTIFLTIVSVPTLNVNNNTDIHRFCVFSICYVTYTLHNNIP